MFRFRVSLIFCVLILINVYLVCVANNFSFANISALIESIEPAAATFHVQNESHFEQNDRKFEKSFEKIYATLININRPFDVTNASFSKSVPITNQCSKQLELYRDKLENLELWALKMFDSNAKLASGLLNGNVNQFGDFDQCLNIRTEAADGSQEVQGKYCLLNVQVRKPTTNSILSQLHKLVYSHYPFKSNLYDPGHRLPRLSTINWALCVPSGCSATEIRTLIDQKLKSNFQQFDLDVEMRLDEDMCQVKSPISNSITKSTILTIVFFLFVLLLTSFATIYDYIKLESQNEFLLSFSLRKNLRQLMSTTRANEDIRSMHGIRFINAFMLILSHKSMALFFNPYTNRTTMSEALGKNWTVLTRAASLYTDPFIMMSGTITAYSIFGRLHRNQKINFLNEYLSRFFRLVPTLSALILFATNIMPLLGSGPQWNLVVTSHSNICKKTWWRNLLFIHNYYGFENMCLTHTHHVGIDTQLFLVFPVFIWILWKWKNSGVAFLVFLAGLSTYLRFFVTIKMNLSNYVHYGTSIKQLFATADNMYTLPVYRATVYIMGILLGYFMRRYPNVIMKQSQLQIGNIIAFTIFCVSFFGASYMGNINYQYNPMDAAYYAAFSPIAWCLSFIWIIYTSHMGYESFLSRILSWKGFIVATRLSYAVYLTQFPIFFYNVGIKRSAEFYNLLRMNANLMEIVIIYFFSIVLTLLFDTPFQNLKKCLLNTKTSTSIVITDKIKSH